MDPIALLVKNKDLVLRLIRFYLPARHADLAGLLKYGFTDIRQVLERASARSTAAIVGVGALCKILLSEFKIGIASKVLSIKGEASSYGMKEAVKEAIKRKDTVGGVFEVRVKGAPVGLGSYVQPDKRLDAKLAQAVVSIPGVKAIEIGLGFGYAESFGSEAHDAIYSNKKKGTCVRAIMPEELRARVSNGEEQSACLYEAD